MIAQFKPERRILYLEANLLNLWLWQAQTPVLEASFGVDETGVAAFKQYLTQHPKSLFYLLADVVEEDFRQEELPFVRGKDRDAMLERKLNQYFFGTPFAFARSLGRNSDGRRDERFVLLALTRAQTFEPWLDALNEAKIPLVGIYSSSQSMTTLARGIAKEEASYILMTLSSSGLRQSYFEAGELRFSRLTPLVASSLSEIATALVSEAGKIHQYLLGQRLVSRGQQIKAYCLTDSSDFARLREVCEDSSDISFHRLDTHALNSSHISASTDGLIVAELGNHPPAQHFLPAKMRGEFRLWQTQLGLSLAALGSLAASLLFALWIGANAFLNVQAETQSKQQARSEEANYNAMVASLPPVHTNPDDLRSLAEAGRALMAQAPTIDPALQTVSQALEATPQLTLTRLNWRLANTPDDAPTNATASNTAPGTGAASLVVIDIEAQLPASLNQDKRAMSELIERFATLLKAKPQANTRTLSRPFDTDSSKSLKALPDSKAGSESLRVTIRYWQPIAP